MKYYHITDRDNLSTILKEGLKANEEGNIFLFENKSIVINSVENTVADLIAYNQIFLEEYVMLEIDLNGITSEIINDNVGELSSSMQWIINQPLVKPEHIKSLGVYKTEFKPFWKI